jgi:DNA (cytosine-5)-methyltransferase 1
MKFIDLFCGIGGFRMGFENNGFECVFSSEVDSHAKETYNKNFNEIPFGDITQIPTDQIPDHDIMLAGFPCQPFSISGKKLGFLDTRGTLFFEILRIAKDKQTPIIVLENVKNIIYQDDGRTLEVILETLKSLKYNVTWEILNASNFGVPQNRERFVLVAAKDKNFNFSNVLKKEKVFLKDFLETDVEFEFLDESEYTLLEKNEMKKQLSGLIFSGYRNKPIRKTGVRENTMHLSRVHKQPNRIYSNLGVHPTLNSQETNGRYFISTSNGVRKLTLNECFRIMGFPNDFKMIGPKTQDYRRIGNSICVPMIEEIARVIKRDFFSKK